MYIFHDMNSYNVLTYWNHICNSYMLLIFIDSILYSFHTDRADGMSLNASDPFHLVIHVLLERQVLASCNELIIWISTTNLVYELIMWISTMNLIYEIHVRQLDVCLLAALAVLAPLLACRDKLPAVCPSFT